MYSISRKLAACIEDVVSVETADAVIKRIRPGKEVKTNEDKIEVIAYGLIFVLGTAAEILTILLVSLLLGSVLTTILMALVFASFRVMAGGQHMDTYLKCFAISILIFILFGAIAEYLSFSNPASYVLLLVTVGFSLYTAISFIPRLHPNHFVRKEKQKIFKITSLVYIAVFAAVMLILGPGKHMVACCFGLLWVCFTIVPAGYSLFERINRGLKW